MFIAAGSEDVVTRHKLDNLNMSTIRNVSYEYITRCCFRVIDLVHYSLLLTKVVCKKKISVVGTTSVPTTFVLNSSRQSEGWRRGQTLGVDNVTYSVRAQLEMLNSSEINRDAVDISKHYEN